MQILLKTFESNDRVLGLAGSMAMFSLYDKEAILGGER